jgi:hypothetical protein
MAFSLSGLCSLPSGVLACLSGLARFLVPGLYEVVQHTLPPRLSDTARRCGLVKHTFYCLTFYLSLQLSLQPSLSTHCSSLNPSFSHSRSRPPRAIVPHDHGEGSIIETGAIILVLYINARTENLLPAGLSMIAAQTKTLDEKKETSR